MKTLQIPRNEWTSFFDNLSRKQEGWEVTLEVFGADMGDQIEERHMFLSGVTAEVTDRVGRHDTIEIMMGGKPSRHLTHTITAPVRVELQQTDLGLDSALRIQCADGTTSLLLLS
jgi:Family of unknown function (DUF5335)